MATFRAGEGVVLVPVNWRWTPTEAVRALRGTVAPMPPPGERTKRLVVLCDADCRELAEEVSGRLWDSCAGGYVLEALGGGGKSGRAALRVDPILFGSAAVDWREEERREGGHSGAWLGEAPLDAVAAVLFTSGTTSRRPKGARLTRRAFLLQAEAKAERIGYSRSDAHVHCAPLHHVSGLCALATALHSSRAGRHCFVPRFSPASFLTAVDAFFPSEESVHSEDRVCILAVPAMLRQISAHLNTNDFSGERRGMRQVGIGLLGGDAVDEPVAAMCESLFPNARLYCTYGMTEACSSIAIAPVGSLAKAEEVARGRTERPGTRAAVGDLPDLGGHYVGTVLPHVQVAVLLNGKKVTLAAKRVGELLLRGPGICLGYQSHRDEDTDEDMDKVVDKVADRGWFATGDLGWLDGQGGVHLCGRKGDAIRSGSEMVYPSDVEMEVARCEGVAECMVFGLPDSLLGQRACCVVAFSQGICASASASSDQGQGTGGIGFGGAAPFGVMDEEKASLFKQFLRDRGLASYRIPKTWFVASESLPRTANGKLLRGQVTIRQNKSAL